MKHFLLLFLAFWSAPYLVFSQQPLLQDIPNPAGFLMSKSAVQLRPPVYMASLTETLDHVFDSITASSAIKGFNTALRLPDGSIWKRAAGLAEEIPAPVPLSTDHLMGMGSITKPFVATTLLLLYEDGLLDLDDSIGQYVGPYPNISGQVTIRQLLGHRSGFNDYINENPATGDAWFAHPDSIWIVDTLLHHYVLAPNFPPDSAWSYSNTNYALAGRIIEKITGQPWYQVVRQRILTPLGLTHTFAYPWETPGSQPFSHIWADVDGNGTVEDLPGMGIPTGGLFSLANSGGCLITTPSDLVIFCERLFGGHVLQAATLAEMQTDYVQHPELGLQYGLGAASFNLNIENWGHDGDLLYKSVALYFPTENISLAVQQNDDRSYDPADPAPIADVYIVFSALLEAYLNYSPVSASPEITEKNGALTVFPNPAGDLLYVQFPATEPAQWPLPCTLSDLQGRIIFSQQLAKESDALFTGALPGGIYMLRAGNFVARVVRL